MPVRAATLLAAVLLGSACGREPEIAGEPLSVHVERLASGPAHVRLRALRVLGGAGRDASQAVPAIAGCLADPDRSVQAAAAEALGAIGDARAQTALLRALGDPDLSAQAFDAAADAAARSVPAAELGRWLEGVAASDPARAAQWIAGDARWAALGDEDRRTVVLALATAPHPGWRASLATLRRIADLGPAAAPALPFVVATLAGRPDLDAGFAALTAIGTPEALKETVAAVLDASPVRREQRLATVAAFVDRCPDAAIDALRLFAEQDAAPAVRRSAYRHLACAAGDRPDVLSFLVERAVEADAIEDRRAAIDAVSEAMREQRLRGNELLGVLVDMARSVTDASLARRALHVLAEATDTGALSAGAATHALIALGSSSAACGWLTDACADALEMIAGPMTLDRRLALLRLVRLPEAQDGGRRLERLVRTWTAQPPEPDDTERLADVLWGDGRAAPWSVAFLDVIDATAARRDPEPGWRAAILERIVSDVGDAAVRAEARKRLAR